MCRWYEEASQPVRKSAHKIGLLMILMGVIWFGVKMGWFDFTLIQPIPFGPVIVIIIGMWMVYRGVMAKRLVS